MVLCDHQYEKKAQSKSSLDEVVNIFTNLYPQEAVRLGYGGGGECLIYIVRAGCEEKDERFQVPFPSSVYLVTNLFIHLHGLMAKVNTLPE